MASWILSACGLVKYLSRDTNSRITPYLAPRLGRLHLGISSWGGSSKATARVSLGGKLSCLGGEALPAPPSLDETLGYRDPIVCVVFFIYS